MQRTLYPKLQTCADRYGGVFYSKLQPQACRGERANHSCPNSLLLRHDIDRSQKKYYFIVQLFLSCTSLLFKKPKDHLTFVRKTFHWTILNKLNPVYKPSL